MDVPKAMWCVLRFFSYSMGMSWHAHSDTIGLAGSTVMVTDYHAAIEICGCWVCVCNLASKVLHCHNII